MATRTRAFALFLGALVLAWGCAPMAAPEPDEHNAVDTCRAATARYPRRAPIRRQSAQSMKVRAGRLPA